MTKLKLVPTPTPNSGPPASPPSERFLTGIVEPGPPYLVPLPGGKSWNAPEQAPAAKAIKDYPLAVRKLAREMVKARWDRQSQQPPQQAPEHLVEIVEPGPPYLVPLPGGAPLHGVDAQGRTVLRTTMRRAVR